MGTRSPDPAWLRPIKERLTPVIQAVIVIDALLFAFFLFAPAPFKEFFKNHLAVGSGMLAGELWQPVTALFVHLEPLSFLFNVLGLWWVGAGIERTVGTRRFSVLFFGIGIVANVVMGLLAAALHRPEIYAGGGPAVLALFAAFGSLYGRQEVRLMGALVMPASRASLLLVGFSLVMSLTQAMWPAFAGDLLASVLGYVLAGGRGDGLRNLFNRPSRGKPRRRYQVIEGGRKDPPRPPSYLN